MTSNGQGRAVNAIEVEHMVKKFGEFTAVNDVSFTVARREIFGLLGPNGAGKTTLIRIMTTLTPPTSGTARIDGHDIRTDPNAVRNTLGVIPQAFTSDPELTAKENMVIHAKLYSVPADKRDALIDSLLESVELLQFRDNWWERFPAACGGGWKSRAGWFIRRRSCFWMSRLRASILSRGRTCGR